MKVIATDYDGTLNYGGIDHKKREAIALWRKKGNLFGIVSGRSEQSLIDRVLEDKIEVDFLIANNGATICDGRGKLLESTECMGDYIEELISFLFSEDCVQARVHSRYGQFIVKKDTETLCDNEIYLSSFPKIESFYQVSALFLQPNEAMNTAQKIREKFPLLYNPLNNRCWIDIVTLNMCKSEGIHSLEKIYGINSRDIITLGDSENDIDMLKNFRSFAMENALDITKEAADNVISGITELIYNELNI